MTFSLWLRIGLTALFTCWIAFEISDFIECSTEEDAEVGFWEGVVSITFVVSLFVLCVSVFGMIWTAW